MADDEVTKEFSKCGAVAIKIPPFWLADPQLWFVQIEAQFAARGITSETTKYLHVVAALPPDTATIIRDVLIAPDPMAPYTKLRAALIERTVASERQRLQALLTRDPVGDRKPSELLRHMQQQLGEGYATFDRALFKQLFLQRLPTSVQAVLAAADKDSNTEYLAGVADKVMEVQPPSAYIAATSPNPKVAEESKAIQELRQQMSELLTQISRIQQETSATAAQVRGCGCQRSRSHSRNHPRIHNRSSGRAAEGPPPDGICWYHHKYQDRAEKCKPPCKYQGNSAAEH